GKQFSITRWRTVLTLINLPMGIRLVGHRATRTEEEDTQYLQKECPQGRVVGSICTSRQMGHRKSSSKDESNVPGGSSPCLAGIVATSQLPLSDPDIMVYRTDDVRTCKHVWRWRRQCRILYYVWQMR